MLYVERTSRSDSIRPLIEASTLRARKISPRDARNQGDVALRESDRGGLPSWARSAWRN